MEQVYGSVLPTFCHHTELLQPVHGHLILGTFKEFFPMAICLYVYVDPGPIQDPRSLKTLLSDSTSALFLTTVGTLSSTCSIRAKSTLAFFSLRVERHSINILWCEVSFSLAMKEVVQRQWNIVSWVGGLICQRPGVEETFNSRTHSHQLLVSHIAIPQHGTRHFPQLLPLLQTPTK